MTKMRQNQTLHSYFFSSSPRLLIGGEKSTASPGIVTSHTPPPSNQSLLQSPPQHNTQFGFLPLYIRQTHTGSSKTGFPEPCFALFFFPRLLGAVQTFLSADNSHAGLFLDPSSIRKPEVLESKNYGIFQITGKLTCSSISQTQNATKEE